MKKVEYTTFNGKYGNQAKMAAGAAALAMAFALIFPHFLSGPPGGIYHFFAVVVPSGVMVMALYQTYLLAVPPKQE